MEDYPNVFAAEQEQGELEQRYQDAMQQAKVRGSEGVLKDFENEVLGNTKAVINRSRLRTENLAESENEVYASYYTLIRAGVTIPKGDKWDILRGIADTTFFTGYEDKIRFGALSLNHKGLFSYGECCWVLKESMISHRASLMDENTCFFLDTHKILTTKKGLVQEGVNIPKGYRATWQERGKLTVAKHGSEINSKTEKNDYENILIKGGDSTDNDVFIEVHIWGPMTVRTLERVIARKSKNRRHITSLKIVKEKVEKYGVKWDWKNT